MKYLITIILTFYTLFAQSQNNLFKEIKKLNGIWIAVDYYNSFEKTKSSIKSKEAFDPSIPVGLRINSKETKDNVLNIGCSYLHDHDLWPEVSEHVILNGDTLTEQSNFKLNLNEKDSLNFYRVEKIGYHNCSFEAFLTWNYSDDTTLILYNPNIEKYPGKYIEFKRIASKFDKAYEYPNPLYYYTRSRTLAGNYILKDSTNKILSKNFIINLNGTAKGYSLLENKIFFLSTDIYCGHAVSHDYIFICDNIENLNNGYKFYFYKRIDKNTIYLQEFKRQYDGLEIVGTVPGNIIYKLCRRTMPNK